MKDVGRFSLRKKLRQLFKQKICILESLYLSKITKLEEIAFDVFENS